MFQFLIGRLDTPSVANCTCSSKLFQFLIGRLDTIGGGTFSVTLSQFQFLIGRLDTGAAVQEIQGRLEGFNSS